VPVVIADATLPETLESVSLASASAAAVLTSDDLANLETGLAVRDQLGTRWERTPVVLRMFDPELARSIRHNFGFRNVKSTAALAAPWFVGAALGLDVLNTFYVGDEPLLVARLKVTRGGGLDGLAMQDLGARTRILAHQPDVRPGLPGAPAAPRHPVARRGRGLPDRPLRRTARSAPPGPPDPRAQPAALAG
jgi:Trk K+ transport system NAD-binding subunit